MTTFLKSPRFLGGAAILTALIVGFFFYRGFHQKKTTLKAVPVAQAPVTTTPSPASVPTSPQTAKADKPSPFGSPVPVVESATKTSEKPAVKLLTTPKAKAQSTARQRQVERIKKSNEEIRDELLRLLVRQGITVHLIDETPRADAEGAAEEKPMSDKELAEAYKEAVRKGRLP